MPDGMYQYYEQLREKGVILYFNGPVSQGVVEGVADLMREKMRNEDAGMKVTQRIFSILVEQMQNIVRYSAERDDFKSGVSAMGNGQIIVGREDDGLFYVACGNRIRSEDGPRLRDRIQQLQTMAPEELKAFYKEQRRNGSDPSSRGAGLGFIEMARKASRPFDFDIVPVNDGTSFFSMKVVA